ncbi:crotonase/enoyl-CoA hydratase family protein [Rhodococcus sp. IEGM 1307]|uniref:crotonase/enoyl-CoA hydratase family protein n=1 Tax=Rhodococcus sp. IEGM 1307 TaxID=3047091 RepID=UPI0024B6AF11|nr:crotonase/enoyl-CoA hydratase family protein [Rhodococcus sp. IEGM 1307]MDI9977412.1 crotonase/enoyl-CoA hydratase family protein [Rhodococcus sp. IEGM 1307]
MQPPVYSALQISVSEYVATVTLLNSGSNPSMGVAHFEELPLAFAWLEDDDDVRSIIVRGGEGNFSFGLDLVDMHPLLDLARPGASASERQAFLRSIIELQTAFSSVASISKPVIAAVDGWCIGAGVDLISSVDVRLATQSAKFSIRETRMAMVADLGSLQRLVGIIGDGHLRDLALTGRDIAADEAQQIGLINRAFTDSEALYTAAAQLAQQMARNSPLVLSGIKEVLGNERESRVRAGLRFVAAWNAAFMASQDLLEARNAFLERRTANFTGH